MAKRMVPKTRYPHNLERAYSKQLINLIEGLAEAVLYEFDANIAKEIELLKERSDSFKTDGIADAIQKVINKAKALSLGIFNPAEKYSIASKHVRAINSTSKSQIGNQMRSQSIDPTQSEPWLKDFMETSIAENTSYITSVADDYIAKTEQIILRSAKSGQSSLETRNELVKQVGMSKEKAKFIARDQTGTVFGQMNEERHKRAGIPGFTWSDSGDNRVRKLHQHYNGQTYPYDDPNAPIPGTDYRCRCVAIPEFDLDKIQGTEDGKGFYKVARKAVNQAPAEFKDVLNKHITKDTVVIDNKLNGVAAYNPASNKVKINPYHKDFGEFNLSEIMMHEYGHMIDIQDLNVSNNNSFKIAGQIDSKVASMEELSRLMNQEIWFNNDSVSDIVGAMTSNKITGGVGHTNLYWNRPGAKEKELFADMFTLVMTKDKAGLALVEKQFPMMYASFKKLLGGKP
ncbi:minor capsid protein [Listeria seeligeri]|uniref:minor capsid protein n=1 Tax=Listeria seeligeri TaxID=1640 RepID=UPI001941DCD2|nr:minor capsid protein [Listeria seeligeri]MBM5675599.1 phage head morphogenesis protein [Listeria seeligeri]